MGNFYFGKTTKYAASEAHWITVKHYAHCTVHIARRIWDAVEGDRLKWMGEPSAWPALDFTARDPTAFQSREQRLTKALQDNNRAVAAAVDVMNCYAKQERIQRRVGEQIRVIHHRYRWIDAKPPGQFSPEVREAFYAILDAREYRAAYDYTAVVQRRPRLARRAARRPRRVAPLSARRLPALGLLMRYSATAATPNPTSA